jgi:hypothetical protein
VLLVGFFLSFFLAAKGVLSMRYGVNYVLVYFLLQFECAVDIIKDIVPSYR